MLHVASYYRELKMIFDLIGQKARTHFTGTKSQSYRRYFNLPCAEYGHIRRQRLFPFVCENGVLVENGRFGKRWRFNQVISLT